MNGTTNAYTDFTVGLWQDNDIGNPFDDYIGTDTTGTHPMVYSYNGDANDETPQGYGLQPPAVGTMLISEPTYAGTYYKNDFTVTGNPESDTTFYNYLNARWIDGTHMSYGGDGYNTSAAPTNFAFTGNAGFCGGPPSGWYGLSAGGQPFDARLIISAQPQALAAGETMQVTYAIMMARGYYNDNLGSVCELQKLQDSLTTWQAEGYRNCPSVVTWTTTATNVLGVELFPNPTQVTSTLRFDNPSGLPAQVQLIDMQGRAVAAPQHTTGQQLELDMAGMAQGIYIVKLSVGDRQTVVRLQKQ